jgi:hypothetical protein
VSGAGCNPANKCSYLPSGQLKFSIRRCQASAGTNYARTDRRFLDTLKILNPSLGYAKLEQIAGPVQIICRDHRPTVHGPEKIYFHLHLP